MKVGINLKVDEDIKKKAQEIAEGLGLPLSSIMNALLKQFIRDKGLNISLIEPRPKLEIKKLIKQVKK